MRIEAFVQARMGSTRLPGKVMKQVLGKPLLEFLIERLKQSKALDEIVILTTTLPADDVIAAFCQKHGLLCFRGSEENVLERYYQAAVWRNCPEGIVRITSDCPLIDPEVVDQAVRVFKGEYPDFDYVSNSLERTFPRGLDVEVFAFSALEKAFQEGHQPAEKEHVTLYLYRHPEQFRLKNVASAIPGISHHRWTVDTPEDFELIRLILEDLYPRYPEFRWVEVLKLLEAHPKWVQLNAHVQQKAL